MILSCFSLFCSLLGVAIALGVVTIAYFKWSYSYWKRRNLPSLTPTSWYGTMENPFARKTQIGFWFKNIYDEFKKRGLKHGGLYSFTIPVYFPVDPDIIKCIMQNDFQYFMDRGLYYNEKADPLSAHLFAIGGQKWRNLRVKLTPTFTSGKMKMMFETLVACSHPLKTAIDDLTENKQPINMKEQFACYTTDVIGSCAFGLECNSFKYPNAEFRQCGIKLLQASILNYIMQMICTYIPSIGDLVKFSALPKSAKDFLFKVVKDTVEYRKANNVIRNDILQLLTEIETTSTDDNAGPLTIEEIAAQCLLFFIAGFETSSSTMSFALYEITKNQEIQQKVREEINAVLSNHNGEITYDAMMDLKYMTQVLEETMRKYPIATQLVRKCGKDYTVPNTNVVIEKGKSVTISVLGLHHDPDYYPNPECFDPERFSDENKKGRHQFTYIPFGEGPRICLGLRFGMLQMKVCLTVLIKNYIFSFNQKTPKDVTFNLNNFILEFSEPIWFDAKPIHKSY